MNNNTDHISYLFRDSFQNYRIEPSKELWHEITHSLSIKQFFEFGLNTFNIYYSAAILILSISSLGILSKLTNLRPVFKEQAQVLFLPDTNENETPDTNKAIVINEQPKKQEQAELYWNGKLYTGESIDKIYEQIEFEKRTKSETRQDDLTKSKSSLKTLFKHKKGNEKATVQKDVPPEKELIENIITETLNNELPFTDDNPELKAKEIEQKNKILEKQETEIKEQIITKHVVVYDTVRVVDTVRFIDTVKREVLFPKITKENLHWSIEAFASAAYTGHSFELNGAGGNDFLNKKEETLYPSTSTMYGMNINLGINNFFLQSGISYARLGERFKDEFNTNYIDSSFAFEYIESGGYWLLEPVDTVFFEWIGHTVVIYDKTWVQLYDSTEITVYDTTVTKTNFNEQNYYNYIELPLILGYELNRGKISYSIKTGLVTGFLMNTSGKTIANNNEMQIIDLDKNEIPFVKLNYSLMFGLGFNYRINNKLSILTETYYRKNLNSLFEPKYPVIQKLNTTGVKIGIRYNF